MSSPTPPLSATTERYASETDNLKQAYGHDESVRRHRKISGSARVSLDRETLADSGVGSEEPGETLSVAGDELRELDHHDVISSPQQQLRTESRKGGKVKTSGKKVHGSPVHCETPSFTAETSVWGGGGVDGRKSGSDSAVSVTSTGTNWPPYFGADSRLGIAAFSSPAMSEGSKVSASSTPNRRPGSPPKRTLSPELSRSVRRKQERRRRELDLQETRASLRKHQIGKAKSEVDSGAKLLEQIMAASSKPNFHSLGTIRNMEQRYGRKSQRSREDRIKVARSYESKSTSPTPMAEPDSENRTKVGLARSIQKQPSSRPARRSKSLEKSSASKVSKQPPSQELPSPRGKSSRSRSALPISRSFPSPPPSTSSPRGPAETSDLDDSIHDNRDAAVSNGDRSRSQSSSLTEALSSSPSGDSRNALTQGENGVGGRDVATSEEMARKTHKATDAILRDGLPDIPPLEASTETCLLDWRAVFRVEMIRLRREVNDFRQFCQGQIKLHASLVESSWRGVEAADTPVVVNGVSPQEGPRVGDQLKDLELNMELYKKKQLVLDLETELLAKEEQLSERQQHLEEYEKEILEVESMLNQRQAICDRRQKALFTLDEELQSMRQELEETREHIHSDGSIPESNSERARRNWDMVRRNLMDKQQLLETTVQKYRSELAAASSTIAGKDILISRLQSAAMENEEELNRRERRIQQLESKLTLTLSETRQLVERANSNHSSNNSNHVNLNNSNSGTAFREALNSRRSSSTPGGGSSSVTFADTVNNTGAELTSPFAPRFQASDHQPPAEVAAESSSNPYRLSFRGNAMYRRPSNNAGSEQGEEFGAIKPMAEQSSSGVFSSGVPRMSRKRNSVSDGAISRLTLSTPRTDDKFGRGSSACVIQ